jgi:hypothetical protein
MDYVRLYEAFIKDRRAKEPTLTGYTEKHHILPRSLGGSDELGNLIDLTPEDHFFAHLMLAKIHGGNQWSPVALMSGGQMRDYRPIKSRRNHGWIMAAMAESKRREGAYQFDARVHHLEHKDGRKWSGYQIDMARDLGISKGAACRLVNGKDGSASGWFIQGKRPKGPMGRHEGFAGADHPMYRPEIIEFLHVDGRSFTGTQHGLHLEHGLSKADVCRLARGQHRCAKGWYVKGKPPAKIGRGAAYKIAG